jgi:hypothetical protein
MKAMGLISDSLRLVDYTDQTYHRERTSTPEPFTKEGQNYSQSLQQKLNENSLH